MKKLELNNVVMTQYIWSDEYVGTAEAIVAAGHARWDELPGQPGRGKCMCTFVYPDGTALPKGANRNYPFLGGTRRRQIRRVGKTRFSVTIDVEKEIGERRLEESHRARLLETIQKNALVRFPVGKRARLGPAWGDDTGRIVLIVQRKIPPVDDRVPYGYEGMSICRVQSERGPFSLGDDELWAWEASLEPIAHLRVIQGGSNAIDRPLAAVVRTARFQVIRGAGSTSAILARPS